MWTGQQALQHGLVDHIGGLGKALQVAQLLSQQPALNTTTQCRNTTSISTAVERTCSRDVQPSCYRVQTLREPRTGLSAFTTLHSVTKMVARAVRSAHICANLAVTQAPLALCIDTIE